MSEFQFYHFQAVETWIIHLASLNLHFLSLKGRYKKSHCLCFGRGQGDNGYKNDLLTVKQQHTVVYHLYEEQQNLW